jgi:hypothetical protein
LREKLLVLIAGIAAYGGTLVVPFQYDDYAIFADPAIASDAGWRDVWSPLQTRPLTYLTFWFNFQTGGRSPWSYHALNLAIHLACCLLLLDVLSRLLPRRTAFVAVLLFAVHPLQSEAVIYIFARGGMLATLFCLIAFRCWLMERQWLTVLWFVPALLAKEECAAFPLFLALWPGLRLNWKPIAAMCGLSLVAGLRVIVATSVIAGAGSGFSAGVSPAAYLSAQGAVIMRYLRLFVVPWGFSIDPQFDPRFAWLGWLSLIALVALAWRWPHRIWLLGALVLLAPSSSIFPAADLSADRRMYLPMIALCACAAILVERFRPSIIVGFLVLMAVSRVLVWSSEESLWSEALERAPGKVRPRLMLARSIARAQALPFLESAKSLEPDNPAVYSEIGRLHLQNGNYTEALAAFGKALALQPGNARALNNRGVALMALGLAEAARADFEAAIQADPCQFDARVNLKRFDAPANCRYSDEQRKAMAR